MESEKEASDGEDEDDDNVDTVRKASERSHVCMMLKVPSNQRKAKTNS